MAVQAAAAVLAGSGTDPAAVAALAALELSLLWWYISIHVLLWHSLISIHHFLSD